MHVHVSYRDHYHFVFSQAPPTMRAMSVALAGVMSISLGDLIVIIVAESSLFENRVS